MNLLKEQLTANEIRYRTYFPELTEKNFNPMNDVLFKFIFGRPERKLITIDFLKANQWHDKNGTLAGLLCQSAQ